MALDRSITDHTTSTLLEQGTGHRGTRICNELDWAMAAGNGQILGVYN
jgi:hypothetical protein